MNLDALLDDAADAIAAGLLEIIASATRHNENLADSLERSSMVDVELGKWRSNARSRIRKGQSPRRFVSTVIPGDVADTVWSGLAKASTVEQVDAAFARHPERARPGPGGYRAAEIVDHYTPQVAAALTMGVDPMKLAEAWLGHNGRR